MRFLLALLPLLTVATAFRPSPQPARPATQLAVSRRDVLAAAATIALVPTQAYALSHGVQNREGSHTHGSTWFFDDNIEKVREESQMPTGGKLDLNNAVVVRMHADGDGEWD